MKSLFKTAQEVVIENAIIDLFQNDTDYFTSSIEERLKNITIIILKITILAY